MFSSRRPRDGAHLIFPEMLKPDMLKVTDALKTEVLTTEVVKTGVLKAKKSAEDGRAEVEHAEFVGVDCVRG